MVLRVKKRATISEFEMMSKQLEMSGRNGTLDLTIPLELKHTSLGGEVLWSQLVTQWLNRPKQGALKTYFKDFDHIKSNISDTLKYLPLLIAILESDSILYQNGSEADIKYMKHAAMKQLRIIQSGDPFQNSRGRVCQIIAADHLGLGQPKFFYDQKLNTSHKLRPRSRFIDLSRFLLERYNADRFSEEAFDKIVTSLGTVLYEIFKNTDDHARTNLDGDLLKYSFRGMQLEVHSQDVTALHSIADGYAPIASYIPRVRPPQTGEFSNLANFLVLSIFDTGPGLACRYSSKSLENMTLQEEEECTRECFTKVTSKAHDRFGQGLLLLGKALERHDGFLQLRTGRLSMYFDSANSQDDATFASKLKVFRSSRVTGSAQTCGAALTMILPISGDE